ncbi:MAG: COX15/CtaA family protein [Acidobacteria bacterium]|nr:COX15/CtaA family protein [Acidobacteriota bacterium]
MVAPPNTSLHRFALLTAAATFLLLAAGALVTSNDAGLAVPDWPLSYGTWMPPMVGNIFYEHGHRMVATVVGLLTTVLALWLCLKEPRRWVRRLGLVALGVVVLQGVLGGITVLFLLPRPVSIAHATLAQLFFCLAVSLAVFAGPAWREEAPKAVDASSPPLRRLSQATALALLAQLILGAAFRHSAAGIVPHLFGAAVVAFLVAWTARRVLVQFAAQPELVRSARMLAGLLAAQLLLGAGAYLARLGSAESAQPELFYVAATVAHVAAGGATLASSVVLTLWCYRRVSGPGESIALASTPQRATI